MRKAQRRALARAVCFLAAGVLLVLGWPQLTVGMLTAYCLLKGIER